jgi:hypothetical protein
VYIFAKSVTDTMVTLFAETYAFSVPVTRFRVIGANMVPVTRFRVIGTQSAENGAGTNTLELKYPSS